MSNLLKDIYSIAFFEKFADCVAQSIPSFNKNKFISLIFDTAWDQKELKERMKHTADVLHQFLPKDFEAAVDIIEQIIHTLRANNFKDASLEFMFFPDYIERYGINHPEAAIQSIEFVTQFTSCEFAVRPFIIKYEHRMLKQMLDWSLHPHYAVRRLSSEGVRPRLPWAIALPALKKNPNPILPILENLKDDSSEWVRRSVANNLNDIAKDHPDVVIAVAHKWANSGKETDAIIKHGSRTLLKQGNPDILKYYGLNNSEKIKLSDFDVATPDVAIGNDLLFAFNIENDESTPQVVRIEYGIHYLRQNGKHNLKVFKISERLLAPQSKITFVKKHSFRIITTRRFYSGVHKLSVIINGVERESKTFVLI